MPSAIWKKDTSAEKSSSRLEPRDETGQGWKNANANERFDILYLGHLTLYFQGDLPDLRFFGYPCRVVLFFEQQTYRENKHAEPCRTCTPEHRQAIDRLRLDPRG